jgi:hypothetical protein
MAIWATPCSEAPLLAYQRKGVLQYSRRDCFGIAEAPGSYIRKKASLRGPVAPKSGVADNFTAGPEFVPTMDGSNLGLVLYRYHNGRDLIPLVIAEVCIGHLVTSTCRFKWP